MPLQEIFMLIRLTAAAFLLALTSGCQRAPEDARQVADQLTGDAKGSADTNPMCRLFSVAEASTYSGGKLQAGSNAAMGSGCQWASEDGEQMTMVTSVPAEFANKPSQAPHYRALPELGKGAYVAADMGGWIAGAPLGGNFVGVVVVGPNANEKSALALLDESLRRQK
jgi:hypothetical protein